SASTFAPDFQGSSLRSRGEMLFVRGGADVPDDPERIGGETTSSAHGEASYPSSLRIRGLVCKFSTTGSPINGVPLFLGPLYCPVCPTPRRPSPGTTVPV